MKSKFLFVGILLIITACQDDLFSNRQLDEDAVLVPVSFRIANEVPVGATTRSTADANETRVDNVWVFQFDGTEDTSRLLTTPQYVEAGADDSNILAAVVPSAADNRLLFIANTNSSVINWRATKGVTTYKEILEISGQRRQEDEMTGLEKKNVVMCGIIDGPVALGKTFEPELYRCLAKIQLQMTVDQNCDYEVVSVQLCNVPTQIFWADYCRWSTSQDVISPKTMESKFQSYALYPQGELTAGNSKTYTWYMPRNARGVTTNENISQKDKNQLAPGNATYILIYAKHKSIIGMGRYYRIFPGADLIKDFNIQPNHCYPLVYTISNNTVGEDARRTDVKDVEFVETANCYILNPPTTGMDPIAYTIPAVARVNQFYGKNQYATINKESAFKGFNTSADTWTCKIIWYDNPKMITAGQPYEVSAATLYLPNDSRIGNGTDKLSFKVVLPPLNREQYGSLVVGIYDKDNVCRWSWHLWITDYNPDVPVTIDPMTFTYSVPGGQVDRLVSSVFGYRKPKSDETKLSGLYAAATYYGADRVYDSSPDINYCYNRSYLMDRNLGARSAYGASLECGGYLYQYGRKDPFGTERELYGEDGNVATVVYGTNTTAKNLVNLADKSWLAMEKAVDASNNYVVTMSDALKHPEIFYSNNKGAWMGVVSGVNTFFEGTSDAPLYVWQDPTLQVAASATAANTWDRVRKSLFDPCPPGWQVPAQGVLSFEKLLDDIVTNVTAANKNGQPSQRGMVVHGIYGTGCYYWPNIRKNESTIASVDGVIFFPCRGYLNCSSWQAFVPWSEGEESYTRQTSFYWVNNRYTTDNSASGYGYTFNINNTDAPAPTWKNNNVRANGYSVRCIKSPDIPAGM